MENETVAMRIIKVVNEFGGNMSEFARKIGVSPAYISKLSKQPEKCRPSTLVINAVCEKCKVNRDWLLIGDGGPDVVFDTAPESDIDKLLRELKPEARDRILIEKFRSLPDEGRQAIMEYALKVAAAAQEESRKSMREKAADLYDAQAQEEEKPDAPASSANESAVG